VASARVNLPTHQALVLGEEQSSLQITSCLQTPLRSVSVGLLTSSYDVKEVSRDVSLAETEERTQEPRERSKLNYFSNLTSPWDCFSTS